MAISLDGTSISTQFATTGTWTHTVTSNTNGILIVGVGQSLWAGTVGTVTYAGNALTKLTRGTVGTLASIDIWYLTTPPTGANSVIVSNSSATGSILGFANSYTGVNQVSIPDAQTGGNNFPGSTSLSGTLTTIANNCWVMGAGVKGNIANSLVPPVNLTTRENGTFGASSRGNLTFSDSNSAISPASTGTYTWTTSTNASYGISVFSLSPSLGVAQAEFRSLLGVGI